MKIARLIGPFPLSVAKEKVSFDGLWMDALAAVEGSPIEKGLDASLPGSVPFNTPLNGIETKGVRYASALVSL